MANQMAFDQVMYDVIGNIDNRQFQFDQVVFDVIGNMDNRQFQFNQVVFDVIGGYYKGMQVNNVSFDIIHSSKVKPKISRPKKVVKNLS